MVLSQYEVEEIEQKSKYVWKGTHTSPMLNRAYYNEYVSYFVSMQIMFVFQRKLISLSQTTRVPRQKFLCSEAIVLIVIIMSYNNTYRFDLFYSALRRGAEKRQMCRESVVKGRKEKKRRRIGVK